MLVVDSAGFVGQEVRKGKQKESMQQHVWPKMASLPMTYDFSTFIFSQDAIPPYSSTWYSPPTIQTQFLIQKFSATIGFVVLYTHFWPWFRELSLVISIIKRTNLNVPQYVQCCCMPRVMIATCTCGSCLFSHKWIHLWPAAITGKWAPVSGEGDRWKPSLTLSESLGYYKHSPNTMRVTELL